MSINFNKFLPQEETPAITIRKVGIDFNKFIASKPTETNIRTVSLPEHLGGGEYKTSGAGTLIKEPVRSYGGLTPTHESERDHIVSYALGGTNNIKNVEYKPSPRGDDDKWIYELRQGGKVVVENKTIEDFKDGKIDLPEARAKIAHKQQQIKGLIPEQGTSKSFLSGLKDVFMHPIESVKKIIEANPQTKQALKDLDESTKKGEVDIKKTVQDFSNSIKESGINYFERLADVFEPTETGTKSERVGEVFKAVAGTAGLAFSPITATFEASKNIPVLGGIASLINLPLAVAGDTITNLSNEGLNALVATNKIKKETAENIREGVNEVLVLAGQIVVAGKMFKGKEREAKVKELEKKFDKVDAETILKKAEEKAIIELKIKEETQKPKIDFDKFVKKEKEIQKFELTKPEIKELNKLDKANYKLAEKLPPIEEGKVRVYQTSGIDTGGVIKKGSYVDTLLKEHIARGLSTEKKTYIDIKPSELTKSFEETSKGIFKAKNDIEGTTYNDFAKPVKYVPIEEPSVRPTGTATAGIAKSIETKAIEQGLIEGGFDSLASFERTTLKDQAKIASEVIKKDINNARAMVRGEVPLPTGLNGISLVKAMETVIKKTKDGDLAYELANSPLVEQVSLAAQELSLTRGRTQDSATAKIAQVKKAREKKASKAVEKKKDIKKDIKKETEKVNLDGKDLKWDKFLDSISC